jgi:methionyl-tRNA synthetase
MPESGGKLLDLLSVPEDARDFGHLGEAGRLKPGTELPAPTPVFPRYVEPEGEGR